MAHSLTEMGIGGVFALMVLREVFSFLKAKRANPEDKMGELDKKIDKILKQTDDLWQWHSVTDSDGVKLWYLKPSLEKTIGSLADNIGRQTQVLQGMLNEIKDSKREIDRLESAIKEVKDKIN